MLDVTTVGNRHLLRRIDELEREVELLRQKLAAFEQETKAPIAAFPPACRLTRQEATVLNSLLARKCAGNECLSQTVGKVWAEDCDPRTIQVHICRLRQKLRPLGVRIETIWGFGYAIEPEHKARVREAIEKSSCA